MRIIHSIYNNGHLSLHYTGDNRISINGISVFSLFSQLILPSKLNNSLYDKQIDSVNKDFSKIFMEGIKVIHSPSKNVSIKKASLPKLKWNCLPLSL